MRRELPGTAKYYRPLIVSLPCSVQECIEPAHASYRTATGHLFCMSHRQRYQLVELAQRLFQDGYMTNQGDVKQSVLHEWIDLALSGDGETVKLRLEAHRDDLVRWKIDESIL